MPCSDVDGYVAAPCWSIAATKKVSIKGAQWFDAPARDHAWWQKKKKRVILYLHHGKDQKIGQVETRTSQDIGGLNVRNTFAKGSLKAGEPIIWLSIFNPYDEGRDASKVASMIKTSINENGSISATVGNTDISINETGDWSVKRN